MEVRRNVWSPCDPLWHSLGVPLPRLDSKWTNAAVTVRRAWWPWPQTLPELVFMPLAKPPRVVEVLAEGEGNLKCIAEQGMMSIT